MYKHHRKEKTDSTNRIINMLKLHPGIQGFIIPEFPVLLYNVVDIPMDSQQDEVQKEFEQSLKLKYIIKIDPSLTWD